MFGEKSHLAFWDFGYILRSREREGCRGPRFLRCRGRPFFVTMYRGLR